MSRRKRTLLVVGLLVVLSIGGIFIIETALAHRKLSLRDFEEPDHFLARARRWLVPTAPPAPLKDLQQAD